MSRRTSRMLAALVLGPAIAQAQADKSAVTLSELQTLADAMTLVELDTGYFTTLENLDDLPTFTFVNPFDYIDDMGGALAIRPSRGDFAANPRVDFLNLPASFAWQGPYISVQSSRIEDSDGDYDQGTILDIWGEPYYFYTPVGLVDPKVEDVTLRFYGDDFADYRIVSHGPDGVFGTADDLSRFVAPGNITTAQISSTRVATSSRKGAEPYQVRVKGFRFGNAPGTLSVGGVSLVPDSWSDQLVTAPIGFVPAPNAQTELTPAIGSMLTFGQVVDETPPSGVGDWELYR